MHRPAKLAGHVRVPMVGGADDLCELCDDAQAAMMCEECDQRLCKSCCTDLHKPAKMTGHKRVALAEHPGAAAPAPAAAAAPSAAAAAAPASAAATTPTAAATPAPAPAAAPSPVATPVSAPAPTPTPPPAATAAAVAPAPSPAPTTPKQKQPEAEEKTQTAQNPAPAATPAPAAAAKEAASPASPAFTTPSKASRAMSASQSSAQIRSGGDRPRSGRPRSAMPLKQATPGGATGGGDGTGTSAALAGAPRALQLALSPTRNVLSMSYGTRWEEPDLRPFRGPPGTFGSMNRDSSPKKNKNLLYSKSASDILSATTGGSGAAWDRLAKPKVFVSSVISPLYDDVKNCKFAPQINPLSQEIAPGDFGDRLSQSVNVYVTRRLKPEGEALPADATFKPKLNPRPASACVAGGKSKLDVPFVERMYSDLAERKRHAELIASTAQYPFAPSISSSSKRRTAKITTPFLERLKEDLDGRDDGAATRKAEAERLPFPFAPNAERPRRGNFNVFLGRMEGDLDERKTKYEERCKKFGIPTPEEVAAAVRGGKR